MYSLQNLHRISAEAGKKAAKLHQVPYLVYPNDVGDITALARMPFLGTHKPQGWKLIITHFVDSSGFGGEHEPAMSAQSFANSLISGHGYAVTEAGQFQVYVGEYTKSYS